MFILHYFHKSGSTEVKVVCTLKLVNLTLICQALTLNLELQHYPDVIGQGSASLTHIGMLFTLSRQCDLTLIDDGL
jgi:hypothetical protein